MIALNFAVTEVNDFKSHYTYNGNYMHKKYIVFFQFGLWHFTLYLQCHLSLLKQIVKFFIIFVLQKPGKKFWAIYTFKTKKHTYWKGKTSHLHFFNPYIPEIYFKGARW